MATDYKQIKSINCTQCGAPVSIYGGGRRIQTITCGYCGTTLDAKKEYAVLKRYIDVQRPYMPLKIGQTGTIKGVDFTIIGVVEYTTIDDPSSWLEYQIYSPTHGYAWLEYDQGHFIFSHKVRDMPEGPVIKLARSQFKVRERTYKVIDYYSARVSYVEGELTWRAEKNDVVNLIEGIAPPYAYSLEKTATEQEYSVSEYLPFEVMKQAFDMPESYRKPRGIHAAQPYIPSGFIKGLVVAGKFFVPVSIVLLLLALIMGSGNRVLRTALSAQDYLQEDGVLTQQFQITKPERLVKLNLSLNLSNAWTWLDIVVEKDQSPVFSLAKQISYYHGYEGGESWSEGSRSVSTYFKVPEAGEYSMRVFAEGGTGERGNKAQQKTLYISIKEGVIVSRYFIAMVIVSLLALSSLAIRRFSFESRRWSAYSEDDDD